MLVFDPIHYKGHYSNTIRVIRRTRYKPKVLHAASSNARKAIISKIQPKQIKKLNIMKLKLKLNTKNVKWRPNSPKLNNFIKIQ